MRAGVPPTGTPTTACDVGSGTDAVHGAGVFDGAQLTCVVGVTVAVLTMLGGGLAATVAVMA